MTMRRGSERGVAIVTAIWMLLIGVMLVTTMASILTGSVAVSASSQIRAQAHMGALSGIHAAIADLLMDVAGVGDTAGIVITEIRNQGVKVPFGSAVTLVSDDFSSATNNASAYGSWTGSHAWQAFSTVNTGPKQGAGFLGVLTSGTNNPVWIQMPVINATDSFDLRISFTWYQATNGSADASCVAQWSVDGSTWTSISGTEDGIDAIGASKTVSNVLIGADTEVGGRSTLYLRFLQSCGANSDKMAVDTLTITGRPGTDTATEYIEIQNKDDVAHDLVDEEYWIATGAGASPDASTRRYLYPFAGTSQTLAPDSVALVVAKGADRAAIAALVGKAVGDLLWFGRASSASPSAIEDYGLGSDGNVEMRDGAEIVASGHGQPAGWLDAGLRVPDTTYLGGLKSWQKPSFVPTDSSGALSITIASMASGWALDTVTPGSGIKVSAGRAGVDGYGDDWYANNYDTFVLLYSNGAQDVYYRVRVYDEGSKININYIPTKYGSLTYETEVLYYALQQDPRPPFSGDAFGYTTTAAAAAIENLLEFGDSTASGRTNFATPGSLYFFQKSGFPFKPHFFPYLSIYGYREAKVFPVNVNMAETPVLRGVLQTALARSTTDSFFPMYTLTWARVYARRLADSIVMDLTGCDGDIGNDRRYESLDEMVSRVGGNERIALNAALVASGARNLANFVDVASTNYFMLYSTGFTFKHGVDPMTDTPMAQSHVLSVVHRDPDNSSVDILFWQEMFVTADTSTQRQVMLLGTHRYPRRAWDPLQP